MRAILISRAGSGEAARNEGASPEVKLTGRDVSYLASP